MVIPTHLSLPITSIFSVCVYMYVCAHQMNDKFVVLCIIGKCVHDLFSDLMVGA